MKQLFFLMAFATTVLFTKAQNQPIQPVCNPFPKTISVSGSAEMEVVPDEIYVQIDLREYKKKGGDKVELEKIKDNFLTLCKNTGIPDSTIGIASYEGKNASYGYWKMKKSTPDLFANIAYQIKFKESKTMDKLIDGLDDDATANFQIVRVSHSKIQEFRRQLKIQAIKAAKEKGIYLTEAIQEKLGDAITIQEPDENIWTNSLQNNFMVSQYSNSGSRSRSEETDNSGIDFKKMKLRYEVKVLFALR